jgi:hypothetical protein
LRCRCFCGVIHAENLVFRMVGFATGWEAQK